MKLESQAHLIELYPIPPSFPSHLSSNVSTAPPKTPSRASDEWSTLTKDWRPSTTSIAIKPRVQLHKNVEHRVQQSFSLRQPFQRCVDATELANCITSQTSKNFKGPFLLNGSSEPKFAGRNPPLVYVGVPLSIDTHLHMLSLSSPPECSN